MSSITKSATIALIRRGAQDYPTPLAAIPGAPEQLYIIGGLPPVSLPMLAIVGTRKASATGREIAREIAGELARAGIVVVSGLAIGIDAAAHEGAVHAGGKTIAVLANGLDTIYPRAHETLARRILEKNGCLLSEYPPGTPPYSSQFLERNRIISGLSLGVVLIESPMRSGSLVTAKHALDQGREVFVVPGESRHPNYRGSHFLIRNGARLVTNAADILEDLQIAPAEPSLGDAPGTNRSSITEALQSLGAPLTIDNIVAQTKLEPHVVHSELTFLMIEGIVTEEHGKFTLSRI